MSEGFTREELHAVGLSVSYFIDECPIVSHVDVGIVGRVTAMVWGRDGRQPRLADVWETGNALLHDALLRLALAHPESAGDALGEGWGHADAYGFSFEIPIEGCSEPLLILAQHGGVLVITPQERKAEVRDDGTAWEWDEPALLFHLPRAAMPVLDRAWRIADAWQALEGGK